MKQIAKLWRKACSQDRAPFVVSCLLITDVGVGSDFSSALWGSVTVSFHFFCMFSPWQQKARDNRAAQRINKVQLSNDPVKRQQATQPPLPGPYDHAGMEAEGGFKDPLKSKESEQEQEWKLRQVSFVVPDFEMWPHTEKSTPLQHCSKSDK